MSERGKLLLKALTVMAAFAALLLAVVGKSSATTIVAPDHVSQTVQGCRNDGTITLPNGSGQFICPDSAYTGGNLGKGWNELDLVPFRLTTAAGNSAPATQTYDTGVAFDSFDGGKPGYDVISPLVLNTSKSSASCVLVSQSGQTDITPGFGGIAKSIGRTVRITQAKNSTCVFDYYGRLALGSHLFPGSSLHGNLSDGALSGTNQDVPIPVKEILPQTLSKDMSAFSSGTQAWSISKSAGGDIHFGNICSDSFSNTKPLKVTVTWTKGSITPSGQVQLITHVYATNPASRTITVTATDKMYEGSTQTTQVGSTTIGSPVDVPANSTSLVLTDNQTVTSSATSFNDVANATYIDKVTQVPVPGSTEATASATVSTSTSGTSATATDSESITGSGLTFAVATPSFGAFTGGYTAGDYVTGPVGWSSGTNTITDSGSVDFNKTIKLDPAQSTSGSITDTAHLTPDGGSTIDSAPLTVNIDSSELGKLTITKTIPNVLQGTETATFQFHVYDSSNNDVADPSVTFTAGQTSKDITVPNLPLDTYTVKEDTASGWKPQDDQTVGLTGCTAGVEFDNQNAPAVAQVKKVTDPTGYEAGWVMTLNGPGTPSGGETVTTTGTGFVPFTTSLQEGSYTITETSKTGWTQISASSECSFTVNYPADNGRTFSCTITNKSRGHVRVVKTINGAPLTASSPQFTFDLRLGDQSGGLHDLLQSMTTNGTNLGTLNFTYDLVPGQTYAICELLMASYNPTISGYGPYNPTNATNYWCWNFSITVAQAADNPSLIFNVDNSHPQSKGLTIGYWKNWSGCKKSKGGQADVLGQYLGGITLGTYTFTNSQADECNAVQTLSKNTFSGVNKSSDPLFNMAAQLLAADLNVNAQAGVCAAAVTAINGAQALLVKYSWNGNTYSPKLTSADATLANQYATALDKYNNNQLC